MKNINKIYLILLILLVLGFFIRAYNIASVPPGIYPDEAINGMDAVRANESGNYPWFYPDNNGREGLYINIIAAFFKLFGVTPLTLKITSILFGTFTILGTYLLAKELFLKERTALISAYLVTISFWAINFSRIAFRAIMVPFIITFFLYFMLRGIRTKKFYNFAISGILFGLGFHTYIAFRITPAILFIFLISLILSRENFLKKHWKHIMVFIIFSCIAIAPLLLTFIQNPEYLESRSSAISIMSPEVNNGNIPLTLAKSFGLSLVKYNFWGDQNWRHNYPPYPILNPLVGVAFLIGIFISFKKLYKILFLRIKGKTRNPEMDAHVLLIFTFFGMLAPEFMTAEGLPHALRSIGTLPIVFIFSGMAFEYASGKIENFSGTLRRVLLSILILLLMSVGFFDVIKYHIYWGKEIKTAYSFNKNLADISKFVKATKSGEKKFIITSYNTLERSPIEIFNLNNSDVSYLFPNELFHIKENVEYGEIFTIILVEKNEEAFREIMDIFPRSLLAEVAMTHGTVYYVIKAKSE